MDTNLIRSGVRATLIAATGMGGMVSAQSVAQTTSITRDQAVEIALAMPDDREISVEINAETGEVIEVEKEGKDCGAD